ncbi:hypothetical protein P167DRAFT_137220 [Morchella conica CCBAS932]|uniref:Uncharacterized protein n=1 Tax=Morchella conica CCBAS932 TaxID=1392247 RepID=A0A3N4KY47_9PEZI|nr:hypothetical protein P167DRAFT_137220 [Morchella conica CCBAS932]
MFVHCLHFYNSFICLKISFVWHFITFGILYYETHTLEVVVFRRCITEKALVFIGCLSGVGLFFFFIACHFYSLLLAELYYLISMIFLVGRSKLDFKIVI